MQQATAEIWWKNKCKSAVKLPLRFHRGGVHEKCPSISANQLAIISTLSDMHGGDDTRYVEKGTWTGCCCVFVFSSSKQMQSVVRVVKYWMR